MHEPGEVAADRRERALQALEKHVLSGDGLATESTLANFKDLSDVQDFVLELAYTEYVLRQELGIVSSADEFRARFPQLGDELTRMLEVDQALNHESLRGAKSRLIGSEEELLTATVGSLLAGSQFGDYQLLNVIGKGGMGIVYRARHIGLKRIVALKMLDCFGKLDGTALTRFQKEAEFVAMIQHPNIVQVFDTGISMGIPYFSMEFVRGGNLAEAIQSKAFPPRTAALLLEKLARAVACAHSQGVIHRDLKPANVLLAPSDASDAILLPTPLSLHDDETPVSSVEPKIADFGLAKQLTSDSEVSHTGLIGTPSYMAPEQASLERSAAGPSCDVYSLGAILYHLLVGRPPFQAATTIETLHQLRLHAPVSPKTLQSSVPPDLETICLKCLAKEPMRRYASASLLADDLLRFINGKPIEARPIGLGERAVKWVWRYPAQATLLVVTAIALLIVSVQWYRAELYRDQAEAAAEDAKLASVQTLAALRRLTDDVVVDKFASQSTLSETDRAFVAGIAEMYLQLAELPGDDREHDAIRAEGLLNAGRLQLFLNTPEQGRAKLEAASRLYERLYQEQSNEQTFIAYTTTLDHYAIGLIEANLLSNALQVAQLGIQTATNADLPLSDAGEAHRVQSLADAFRLQAYVYTLQSQTENARNSYLNVITLLKERLKQHPAEAKSLNSLAGTLRALSSLEEDRLKQLEFCEQSIVLLRELVSSHPQTKGYRKNLAWALYDKSDALLALQRNELGLETIGESVSLTELLHRDFPAILDYQSMLAVILRRRGEILAESSRHQEAIADTQRSIDMLEASLRTYPATATYHVANIRSWLNLSRSQSAMGDEASARSSWQAADAALQKMKALVSDSSASGTPSMSAAVEELAQQLAISSHQAE